MIEQKIVQRKHSVDYDKFVELIMEVDAKRKRLIEDARTDSEEYFFVDGSMKTLWKLLQENIIL